MPAARKLAFDPGALCLELLLEPEDGGPDADLGPWVARSRLGTLAPLAPGDVVVAGGDLARLQRLRDAVRRLMTRAAKGQSPSPADLAFVNYCAAAPSVVPQLDERRGRRRTWARPVSGAQIVSSVARDTIELLAGPLSGRIRQCAGDGCTRLFVDASRPGRRRWCSMDRCGNRDKVRAYRERRESAPVSGSGVARRGSR